MTSSKLTIFEGPDGSGKTTAALTYAKATNARYVHFDALPYVTNGLARMYVEAMLPALLGYQNVVLDRCWLSEEPYGKAFRFGKDRLGMTTCRMLERLALRCGALVVHCLPPYEVVEKNYLKRKHLEMLTDTEQLKLVYDTYNIQWTAIPNYVHDYTLQSMDFVAIETFRGFRHPLSVASAGNLAAPIMLVGESFTQPKNNDNFYQWPFASFTDLGCSQWLTQQLDACGIGENQLLWVNADQDVSLLYKDCWKLAGQGPTVIALGTQAYRKLQTCGVAAIKVNHPQYHKRFLADRPYELITCLEQNHERLLNHVARDPNKINQRGLAS